MLRYLLRLIFKKKKKSFTNFLDAAGYTFWSSAHFIRPTSDEVGLEISTRFFPEKNCVSQVIMSFSNHRKIIRKKSGWGPVRRKKYTGSELHTCAI